VQQNRFQEALWPHFSNIALSATLDKRRFETYLQGMEKEISPGLRKAIEAAGSRNRLARKIDISGQAVQQWRDVPARWIIAIEKATGIPREELRPELYRR